MAVYNGLLLELTDDAGLIGDKGAAATPTANLGNLLEEDILIDSGFAADDPNPKNVNTGIMYDASI